jgi:hypothetical protein
VKRETGGHRGGRHCRDWVGQQKPGKTVRRGGGGVVHFERERAAERLVGDIVIGETDALREEG